MERRIVKYRLDIPSPGYEVAQLYQYDKFHFYGTVAGKPPNNKLYKIQLDLVPSNSNEIYVVRKYFTVLAKEEEEPPCDQRHDAMVEECQVIVDKPAAKKSRDHIGESYKVFSNLESGLQAVASNFELKYGDGNEDKIA